MQVVQIWVNRFSWATGARAWHAYLLAACLCAIPPYSAMRCVLVLECGALAYLHTWVRLGSRPAASPFMCAFWGGGVLLCVLAADWPLMWVELLGLAAEFLLAVPPPPPPRRVLEGVPA